MSRTVRAHSGVIDKFIGEKMLAVFLPSNFHNRTECIKAALNAAVEMRQKSRQTKGASLAIGLVTGPVLSGVLGSSEVRLEGTVIGDSVNLASRLCDLAKKSEGGAIFLEDVTASSLQTHTGEVGGHLEKVGMTKVKGKVSEIRVCRWRDVS